VGNRDIANYLIEKGARPNIYVLTMLGETEIVKSILIKYPNLINGLGPHGYTLLHHAMRGGDQAKELLEYFKEKGLKETRIKI
jgi:ankyrin repeat protein